MNRAKVLIGIPLVLVAACVSGDATAPDRDISSVVVSVTDPPLPQNGFSLPTDTVNVAVAIVGGREAEVGEAKIGWHLELLNGTAAPESIARISVTGPQTARIVFYGEAVVKVVASVGWKDGSVTSGTLLLQSPPRVADIILVSGDNQEGAPGDVLKPLVVSVRDGSGKPIAGVTVLFSVTAGDGSIARIDTASDGRQVIVRSPDVVRQLTGSDGQATILWSLGRAGENRLAATVQGGGNRVALTFRATSIFSGYPGGSFSLASNEVPVQLYDRLGTRFDCKLQSGSLVLSPDGSFETYYHFTCLAPAWEPWILDTVEAGYYAVSGQKLQLHYVSSGEEFGLFDPRDVEAVLAQDTVSLNFYGVELRYASGQ